MRIFFASHVGADWRSGWQRARALENIGCQKKEFAYEGYESRWTLAQRLAHKISRNPFSGDLLEAFNKEFSLSIIDYSPEIAWIEKPLLLYPETLEKCKRRLPNCIFVCFQDDDPFGNRSGEEPLWRFFRQTLPMFDIHLVKKDVDLEEFPLYGAKRAIKFRGGYFGQIFRPGGLASGRYRWPVSFVGTAIDRRIDIVKDLMGRFKIDLNVFGNSWNRQWVYYQHRKRFHPAVHGVDYVNTIAESKISLGFVSFSNRDEFTMRSFEIPACKGFFLGQRTRVHQQLYKEGEEAEFFEDAEECSDKIRYYLANDPARTRIAAAGYKRCLDSDYSLERSMKEVLKQVSGII